MIPLEWQMFWAENAHGFGVALGEHIFLTFLTTCLAALIGVILGVIVFHVRWLKQPVLILVGVIQTVPSLALLVLLLALFGRIGMLPALIALTLYALLPIVRGTLTGLESMPRELNDIARVIGMTTGQQLLMVRLPLALPMIVSGIRVSANIGVGMATIAAFIGAGGLGQFINRGLFLSDTKLILLGAVPAALLAILLDQMIALIEKHFFRQPFASRNGIMLRGRLKRGVLVLMPLFLFVAGTWMAFSERKAMTTGTVTIGTKNFTEQIILGEIMAQYIEAHTTLRVERRFGLGGSQMLHRAITMGEIDFFPEYTGTALTSILKEQGVPTVDVFNFVRDLYDIRYNLHVFQPLGFNNSYVLAMQSSMAEALNIRRLSDLRQGGRKLRAGVDFEFASRGDGLKGLTREYGIEFASVRDLDPNIIYSVLAEKQVDIISAFSTDGRISVYGFTTLEDDLHFFPPYHAVIIGNQKTLKRYPGLVAVIEKLSGTLSDDTMRALNYEVDFKHREVADVAREFLQGISNAE
jgi:osmoprotectant transport system permease protein